MNAKLRVNFAKQMHMVGHDFQFYDFASGFVGDFVNNGLQPFGYVPCENLSSVLRAEDDVVLTGKGDIVVGAQLGFHEDIIPGALIYCQHI